jgi:hypothetical protein
MKTSRRHRPLFLTTLFSAALLAAACGQAPVEEDDDEGGATSQDDDGSSGSTTPGGSGSVDFQCCINGVGYACPSNAALTQCIGFDIDACMSGCDFDDFVCQDSCFDQWANSEPDPSACTQDAAVDCSGGGGPGGGGGGLCAGDWDGAYCEVDGDCSSYNCVDDKCYGTAPGNPCEVDGDCSTYNCYSGCCYGTDAGEPCDVDGDCASYNCYENECQ